MPEVIEVRKFADILSENIIGKTITHINILKGRYKKKIFDGYNDLIKALPLKIEAIHTKGKFTYMTFVSVNNNNNNNDNDNNNKKFYLFNTLGLSGGWTLKSDKKSNFANCKNCNYFEREKDIFTYPSILDYISKNNQTKWFETELKHLNVEFITDYKNISFYFYDQLSFGTLKAVDCNINGETILEKKLKELGPDLLDDTTTFELFKLQLRKKVNENKAIGNVIVNQKIISGVGNYLRADSLWMSKISPFRKVKDTTDDELKTLYDSIIGLIWGDYNYEFAIKKKYIKSSLKLPHHYNRDFFIYNHIKDIYNNTIRKEELYEGSQKRFIYWVKSIQV
jgi:formamidopyrimidine-DNA glycosylase